jgi:alkanesulfonate monooxygenase SsuD/methylene tetrahydromethanopterin reductase-like flavin-dependent oxidoreductase (luciferase family)
MTTERIADHVKFACWVPNVSGGLVTSDIEKRTGGFRRQLIGTPEQIAERVAAYRKRGVDLVLGWFLHF